jgi:hypothetical protein
MENVEGRTPRAGHAASEDSGSPEAEAPVAGALDEAIEDETSSEVEVEEEE